VASGFGVQTTGAGDINVNSAIAWTNPQATLTLLAYNAINVNAPINGSGAVLMQAGMSNLGTGNRTIAVGGSIWGAAGVTLGTSANFVNLAGANAVSAGSTGTWLVYSTNPTLDTLFDVEIESCTRCGGELKIIASIEEPQLIAKILSHLERAAPEQYQSELALRKRGPPAQSSLL
jgi:hypothetical protein